MLIRLDPKGATPVYRQIVDEIKAAIARGACRAGETIPSVRQMAAQALVNPNTVAKAYRELEREGIVFTRRGRGVFVSDNAPGVCRGGRRDDIQSKIEELAREAGRTGMSADEMRAALEHALKKSSRGGRRNIR